MWAAISIRAMPETEIPPATPGDRYLCLEKLNPKPVDFCVCYHLLPPHMSCCRNEQVGDFQNRRNFGEKIRGILAESALILIDLAETALEM